MGVGKAGVWILERVQNARPARVAEGTESNSHESVEIERAFFRIIDFRFLLIGSILSDLVDKPLGMVILRQLANGRICAHTLLFALMLLLGAVMLPPRARPAAFAIFVGDIVHLVLDSMWQSLGTLLWPIYGFGFPHSVQMSVGNAISMFVRAFLTDRFIQETEALGAFLIIVMLASLLIRGRLKRFLFAGDL